MTCTLVAQLLDAASGSASSAMQMAAVHAAYNILASQTGWKGLGPAALPPASASDAADDIVSGMSSSLVPDQLLQVSLCLPLTHQDLEQLALYYRNQQSDPIAASSSDLTHERLMNV